jgi:arylsulfatase A
MEKFLKRTSTEPPYNPISQFEPEKPFEVIDDPDHPA